MTIGSAWKYPAAALVGAGYAWLATSFWGWYAANDPINDWLLEVLAAQGHRALYYLSVYTHDLVLNVLLAAPGAFALVAFEGSNNWRCALVSVAAAVIVVYWGTEISALPRLLGGWGFWAGFAMSVFSLPMAFAAIRAIRQNRAH